VYELYAVLVHQGSADFGHYYAFIKNFGDGQWCVLPSLCAAA
jgi:ubiquitin C-terminal hydrolase